MSSQNPILHIQHTTSQKGTVHLQLMLLLPTRQFLKLLLRHAAQEPLQAHKRLERILPLQDLPLGPPNQLLDLQQTGLIQMRPQPLLDLLQHQLQETLRVLGLARRRGDDLVDETRRDELLAGDALAHDEGLVGLGDPQTLDEGARGAALGDQAEGGERGQDEGVRGGVDEVGEGDEGGGEADRGAVQRRDEDLGVVVEGAGDVDVVGDEAADEVAAGGAAEVAAGAGDGHVRSAGQFTWQVS